MNTGHCIDLLKISVDIGRSGKAQDTTDDAPLLDAVVAVYERLRDTISKDTVFAETNVNDIKTALDIAGDVIEF